MGLRSTLQGIRAAAALSDRLEAVERENAKLRKAVQALDDEQVDRIARFTKLRDDVLRHMKRVAELDRREEEKQEKAKEPQSRVLKAVLDAKFNKQGG